MDAALIVDARAVHAWYGSSHVLHGVDLQIRRGETVGLLGRNGMGKSTLIRTLLGHVARRDGYIGLFGTRHVARPAAPGRALRHRLRARRPRHVPEPLRAREPRHGGAARAATPARAGPTDRVLATFPRLRERLHHLGAQLSGGEQQMLSLGRALLTHPRLIILDEATEGLAPLIVREIWRVIERDPRERHRYADRRPQLPQGAGQESDRAVVLLKGRVVLAEASSALRERDELASHLGV